MDPTELTGRVFGPRTFRICAQNVADYVAVTRDDPSRWAEAAPPGFVSAALFTVAPSLLGEIGGSVIHGEQTFGWQGPLRVESEVSVSGRVSRVRDRGGVRFVTFDLEVAEDGTALASGSSLFLVTEVADSSLEPTAAEPDPLDDGGPGPGRVSASRADLIRYAAATRDWNPVHWDHGAAVSAGLPGIVVHGLLQAAWALSAVSSRFGSDHPLQAARIRFRNPLPPATPVEVVVERDRPELLVSVRAGATEYVNARVEPAGVTG